MDLGVIRKRLAARENTRYEAPGAGIWGAIAAILRKGEGGDTEVLLIRRAERQGDPWSGHMAFPGGHAHPEDADLRVTALRETREEVGIDLEHHGELVGRLDDLRVTARGKPTGMVIRPHVFVLHGQPEFSLGDEVAELLWGPLARMASGELDAMTEYWLDGVRVELPAYDLDGRMVWGLTYAMLQNLFAKLRGG